MDITPVLSSTRQLITGYGSGQFKIAGQVYTGSVLVFPDKVTPWQIMANAAITLESLSPILNAAKGSVELLLIGCSKAQMALPPRIRDAVKQAGIGLEVMDTGAAVRTYNICLGEGRRVAAALLAV
jgi:uncharacterized protein